MDQSIMQEKSQNFTGDTDAFSRNGNGVNNGAKSKVNWARSFFDKQLKHDGKTEKLMKKSKNSKMVKDGEDFLLDKVEAENHSAYEVKEPEPMSTAQSIVTSEKNSPPTKEPLRTIPSNHDVTPQSTTKTVDLEIIEEKSTRLPILGQIVNKSTSEHELVHHEESPETTVKPVGQDEHCTGVIYDPSTMDTRSAMSPANLNELEVMSMAQPILVNEENSSLDEPLPNPPKTKQDVPSQITTETKEFEIAEEKSSPVQLVGYIENQCTPEQNTMFHEESPRTAVSQNERHSVLIASQREKAKKTTKPALSHASLTGFDSKNQKSTTSSKTSLSSSGPSTSSLCHLTELSQPKPEVLQTTLKLLRYVNSSDAKVKHVSEHLKDLRNRPKIPSYRKPSTQSPIQRKRTTPAVAPAPKASANRTMFDRMASKFYEYLELRWDTFDNYESTMPVQHVYYQAAYDALTRAYGKPYTKASLELYQLLAAELGLEAETFVIDKTPKTHHIDEHVENIALSIPGGN